MIAVIQHTDAMNDKRIVFGVLSQLKANVIKTDNDSETYHPKITLYVEDMKEIHNILSVLNRNTVYGVSLLKCKETFWEKIERIFGHESKDIFNG